MRASLLALLFTLSACTKLIGSREMSQGNMHPDGSPADGSSDDGGLSNSDGGTPTQVLLFGGVASTSTDADSDLWTWNDTSWSFAQTGASTPPGRCFASMATMGDKVALFGGNSRLLGSELGPFNDTWTWDGTTWTQLNGAGPSARYGAAATSLDGVMVLFGGTTDMVTVLSEQTSMDDTWLLSASGWSSVGVVGPPKRAFASMVTMGSKAILYGGISNPVNETSFSGNAYSDTWEWDGAAWTQRQVISPPARFSAAAAVFKGEKMVLFGGLSAAGTYLAETWQWDGSFWVQLAVAGPSARANAGAAMEPNGDVIVFGGYDDSGALGDAWEWDGATWTQILAAGPTPREGSAMVSR
jgi:N-acetylneuraminic acid mutarotase